MVANTDVFLLGTEQVRLVSEPIFKEPKICGSYIFADEKCDDFKFCVPTKLGLNNSFKCFTIGMVLFNTSVMLVTFSLLCWSWSMMIAFDLIFGCCF